MKTLLLLLLTGCAVTPKVTLITVGPPHPQPILVVPEEQYVSPVKDSPIPIAPDTVIPVGILK